MTTLGLELAWLALRVTLLALFALGMVVWSARRGARSAVVILAGALLLLLVLPLVAFCPLPDAWRWTALGDSRSDHVVTTRNDLGMRADENVQPNQAEVSPWMNVTHWLRNLTVQAGPTSPWHWAWSAAGGLYVLGLAIGSIRLLVGARALAALRRGSQRIVDPELLKLTESLRAVLLCPPVELREGSEPGLAATLGWQRPLILLPPEWRLWSPEELRSVLAHELAHVRHRDFLLGLLTGFCRVLHFYHPLVRWLASQMRWRQEAAADDLAAMALGSRSVYLKALANLALRLPARTPAGAFLPVPAMNGGTLLWRIQMLRRTEQRPLSSRTRGLLIAALAGVALLAAAWRGPAQSPKAEPPAAPTEPFELGYLTPEAKGLVAMRPSVWLKQPGMDKMIKLFDKFFQEAKQSGFDLPDDLKPLNV